MATSVPGILPPDLDTLIKTAKVLVVGAGGVGCELLKNLVLTGFNEIHIVSKPWFNYAINTMICIRKVYWNNLFNV